MPPADFVETWEILRGHPLDEDPLPPPVRQPADASTLSPKPHVPYAPELPLLAPVPGVRAAVVHLPLSADLRTRYELVIADPQFRRQLPVLSAALDAVGTTGQVKPWAMTLTDLAFPRGVEMGVSATLDWGERWNFRYTEMQPAHRAVIPLDHCKERTGHEHIPTQLEASAHHQTRHYPQYGVARTYSKYVVRGYGRRSYWYYEALMKAKLWDDMWNRRTTRVYMLDPAALHADDLGWLLLLVEVMFVARQVWWERLNFFHTGRKQNTAEDEGMYRHWVWLKRRGLLAELGALVVEAVFALRPKSWRAEFDELLQAEPAFWHWPGKHSIFAPDGPLLDVFPVVDQVRRWIDEEPVRMQWAYHPRRFIEALDPTAQLALHFFHQAGASWQVPEPTRGPGEAAKMRLRYLTTPGADFYSPDFPWFDEWVRKATLLKKHAHVIISASKKKTSTTPPASSVQAFRELLFSPLTTPAVPGPAAP